MTLSVAPIRMHACAAVVSLALVVPLPARAAERPPVSAIAQYVEQIPTAEGSATPGVGKTTKTTLPRETRSRLRSGTDATTAAALTEIATSSAYGAPTGKIARAAEPRSARDSARVRGDSEPRLSSSLGSAVEAVGSGSDRRLAVLLAIVLLTTAVAVAAAVRSRNRPY